MIYFIQVGDDGPVKIGSTETLHDRLVQLQVACPYKLKILFVYNGRDFSENGLHELFKQYHMRGEWFRSVKCITEFDKKYPDDCYPITNIGLGRCRSDMEDIYLNKKYENKII